MNVSFIRRTKKSRQRETACFPCTFLINYAYRTIVHFDPRIILVVNLQHVSVDTDIELPAAYIHEN